MREVGYNANVCSVDKSILDDPICRQGVVSPNTEVVNLDASPIYKQQVIKMMRTHKEICADTVIEL